MTAFRRQTLCLPPPGAGFGVRSLNASRCAASRVNSELRLEAKTEARKADILGPVFGLTPVRCWSSITAIMGAMFALAKLLRP